MLMLEQIVATREQPVSNESIDWPVIARCQQGDRDALRALFESYKDRVYSIAMYSLGGDEQLASRVEPSDRLSVYARLAFLVPPPKGTSREGLLSLDREMLDRWREEIDKSRGLNSFGSLQITWRRILTGTAGKSNGPQGKR